MTWHGWDRQLLAAIGGEVRPEPLRFIHTWAQCEGGTAAFNPFNTTLPLPGATPYNSAGVKNYRDALEGLAATLLTLRLPYYRHLLAGLRSPSLTAEQILRSSATDLKTWGTGSSCIANLLHQP